MGGLYDKLIDVLRVFSEMMTKFDIQAVRLIDWLAERTAETEHQDGR